MGAGMVEHLLDLGLAVTVFDLDPARVGAAVAKGATAAGSSAEVAHRSDIVSICVPAAEHVDAVLNGPGGIGEGARAGLTILVHSTVLPETVLAAHAQAAEWGIALHDACVAGGFLAAATGDLLVLAGGLDEMDPAARDLLHRYGNRVVGAGPIGAGAALKLGINVMTYAQFAAVGTAFEVVEDAGGSTESLVDAWRHLGQLGRLTDTFLLLASMPPEEKNEQIVEIVRSSAAIADKDLVLAARVAGTAAYREFLAGVRSSIPVAFGTAGERMHEETGGEDDRPNQ